MADEEGLEQAPGGAEPGDRRQRLVHAARELFFTRGYDATRMIDVAQGAGFSKRTVYLEFESKDELFATICEEGLDIISAAFAKALDEGKDTTETLYRLGEEYLRFWKEHREYFRLLFLRANDDIFLNVPERQMARFREREQSCIDAIAVTIEKAKGVGLVREELDSQRQALVAWMSLLGVLQVEENGRRIDLADATVEDLYWQCFDMMLRGSSRWRPPKARPEGS